MSTNPIQDLRDEADAVIARAAEHGIELTWEHFKVIDGELFVDGMAPLEWLDAMTMDDDGGREPDADLLSWS